MSAGHILLAGGAEFGGRMADPDRQAIRLAGGLDSPIGIIPAAAAPDNNAHRAGSNGQRWFTSLGARRVSVVPLIDRVSAEAPEVAAALREMHLIYLLGGFPRYLNQALLGSAAWRAVLEAVQGGAVVAGSSAGGMVLCQYLYDPATGQVVEGLNLLPGTCMLPHHNTFGKGWTHHLSVLLPEAVLVGIDEETGMLDDGPEDAWQVYGRGGVTLYHHGRPEYFPSGALFHLG